MDIVSHYESTVIQYQNSHEMSEHIKYMEGEGWKPTSVSYGKLRVRYRMDYEKEE